MRYGAFFDMNGTLMRGEPGFEFIVVLHERGHCSDADFARMQEAIGRFRRREISNEAVAEEMFGVLRAGVAGLAVDNVMEAYAVRYRERLRPSIFPYARALVARLRDLGCVTYAVTNVARPLLDPLMEDIGLEQAIAPELEQVAGRFTSRLLHWEGAQQVKGHGVRLVAEQDGIDLAASFAFGDGEGDASFLELVGHPVAVNPTPALLAIATARGWPVVRETGVVDEVVRVLDL